MFAARPGLSVRSAGLWDSIRGADRQPRMDSRGKALYLQWGERPVTQRNLPECSRPVRVYRSDRPGCGTVVGELIDSPAWIAEARRYICNGANGLSLNETFLNVRGPSGFIGQIGRAVGQ